MGEKDNSELEHTEKAPGNTLAGFPKNSYDNVQFTSIKKGVKIHYYMKGYEHFLRVTKMPRSLSFCRNEFPAPYSPRVYCSAILLVKVINGNYE